MNTYFLDTNALVKRYHKEDGSDVIDRIFAESEAHLVISDISIIEFYSAMALKVRTGIIQKDDLTALRQVFSQDVKDAVYEVVEFTQREKTEAAKLCYSHTGPRIA